MKTRFPRPHYSIGLSDSGAITFTILALELWSWRGNFWRFCFFSGEVRPGLARLKKKPELPGFWVSKWRMLGKAHQNRSRAPVAKPGRISPNQTYGVIYGELAVFEYQQRRCSDQRGPYHQDRGPRGASIIEITGGGTYTVYRPADDLLALIKPRP
jgi:hypothetical protein